MIVDPFERCVPVLILANHADGIPEWIVYAILGLPILSLVGVITGLTLMFRGASSRSVAQGKSNHDSAEV